jgi:hypothetical protein
MNVSELIDTISQFAFGTLATERQREEYLRCLNFANNDIYLRLQKNFKHFIELKEQKVLLDNNQYYFEFDFKKNILKSVYNKGNKINSFCLLTNDNLTLTSNHYLSLVYENKIFLGAKEYDKDNKGDNIVKIFYSSKLKKLVEVVSDPNNETDIAIYDNIVDQALILGSVYYIFLTSNGQMSKLSSSYKLFKDKLEEVVNFYNSV